VEACRAGFGGAVTFMYVPAIAAFPFCFLLFLEHRSVLDVVHEGKIPFFMMFFNFGYFTPGNGYFLEAFLFGYVGERGIELGVLLVFALGGSLQVIDGVAYDAGRIGGRYFDNAAFKELEKALRVLFLVIGGFKENRRDLLIPFFLCL